MDEAEKLQSMVEKAQDATLSWFDHSRACARTAIGQVPACNDFWTQAIGLLLIIGIAFVFYVLNVFVKDYLRKKEIARLWALEQEVNEVEINKRKWIEEDPAPNLTENEMAERIKEHLDSKRERETPTL